MSGVFDGTGTGYLSRTALTATNGSSGFWVSIWCKLVKNPDYTTVYCLWASEKADGSNGSICTLYKRAPYSGVVVSGVFTPIACAESIIPDPYWENVIFEYRSATDYRVWINNVQQGITTTSKVIDLSTGSPVTRVGNRAGNIQFFNGKIAAMAVGTGTLTAPDRATLATAGADPSGVTGITNYYPLLSNGNDSIGGSNFTATSMTWDAADSPVVRDAPTRTQLITEIFKQSTLRSESPTVLTGQTSPIAGISNLASTEFIDCAFTGSAGPWNTRMYHFIPTSQVSPTHLVIVDGGHELASEWATYGTNVVVQVLVAAGYGVLFSQMPGFSPSDPDYTGSYFDHNIYWSTYTSSVNPLERFFCHCIALNNLASRYTNISMYGLSGGGWLASYYPAMDPRINHSAIPLRGTIAHRRRTNCGDFEQEPRPAGWKIEDIWPLSTTCRYMFVNHPLDPVIGAQDKSDGEGQGNGAYLAATSYDTAFLAPIRTAQPGRELTFIVDQAAAPHVFDTWTMTNVTLPTLKLPYPSPGVRGAVRMY